MIAASRHGDKPRPRLVLLLIMILLGLGITLADDIDFPDILTPGGGGSNTGGGGNTGGNGTNATVELYLAGAEGASFFLAEDRAVQGLVLSEKAYDLVARRWHEGEHVDPLTPNLRALLVADTGAAVGVTRGMESLAFQGAFDLYGTLATLAGAMDLSLAPSGETCLAVTVVRVSGAAGTPSVNLAEWILHGEEGTAFVFSHTGRLRLSHLLRAAFEANPGPAKLGLLQFEFDAAGALVARKTVEVRRDAEPPAPVGPQLGPGLSDALVLRYCDAFLGTTGE